MTEALSHHDRPEVETTRPDAQVIQFPAQHQETEPAAVEHDQAGEHDGAELQLRRDDLPAVPEKPVPALRRAGRAARPHAVAVYNGVRRHGAIAVKGIEAERQQKKVERVQSDLKWARTAAAAQQDHQAVRDITKMMNDSRTVGVQAWQQRVELSWEITKKGSAVVASVTGVALVTGTINSLGHWLGDWNGLDVLYLVGSIISGGVNTVSFIVTNWEWLAPTALGLAAAVWVSRRYRDGKRLGESVLPMDLRRDGAVVHELDESALVAALANAGIPALKQAVKDGWPNRESDRAWVQFPIVDGPGITAKIRLPQAAPVEKIAKAKTTLAHNLGCLPAELFVDKDESDPTVLDLFRLNAGELRKPVGESPLVTAEHTDYFKGFPVGVSPRGQEITAPVFERNYAISGIMGSGKSTLVLNLLAGAVLDPLVDVDVFCFAENADYDHLKPAFDTFVMGDTEENVGRCQSHIADLHQDLSNRGRLLQKHGATKVSRELAATEPGLRPRMVVIDECQAFFRQDDPKDRKAVVNQVVRFFSAARKYGITLVFVTPLPSDESLPRDLVAVTSNKACFAIGDKTRNNIVLGDKAHENGISALGLKPADDESLNDVGTSVTCGFTREDGTTLRSYYLTGEQQDGINERALSLRGGAQEPAEPQVRDLLADVSEVLGSDEKAKATDVVVRLRSLAPTYRPYADLDGGKLAAQLESEHGVKVSKSSVLWVRSDRVRLALSCREDDDEGTETA